MTKRVQDITHQLQRMELNSNIQSIHPLFYPSTFPQTKYHPMRAIFIALDMTKTIQMKDFKPSRLSVSTQMIKHFIKRSKQTTPIIKYLFSVVQQQICKIKTNFTLDSEEIFDAIDMLKVQNNGFFSLESVLSSALEQFENVSNCYQKQLFIIQASSLTKDYKNIYQTIQLFKQAKIKVNIISLIGWTHIFKKLVQQTQGKYLTVSTNQQFKKFVQNISIPSQIKSSPFQNLDSQLSNPQNVEDYVQKTIFKVALCKKQLNQKGVLCFCHMKQVQNYYVCGFCEAVICKTPPIQCTVCNKIIVIPSDLSRHKLISIQ